MGKGASSNRIFSTRKLFLKPKECSTWILKTSYQKRATTLMSRPAEPPEPGPAAWLWGDPSSSWMWWSPELKLAHKMLLGSLGARATSGPAPSRASVPRQAEMRRWVRKILSFIKKKTLDLYLYLLCSDPRFWRSCHERRSPLWLCHHNKQAGTHSRLWSGGDLCTPLLYSQAAAGPTANNRDIAHIRQISHHFLYKCGKNSYG